MAKFLIVLFLSAIAVVQALECWNCENASSQSECIVKGYLETCLSEDDTCATFVREENGLTRIAKTCKQQKACHNHLSENQRRCKPQSGLSFCTCCCNEDSCNTAEMCATGQAAAQSDCPVVSNTFPHGQVQCSGDSTKAGSVCEFECTEQGYGIYPAENNRIECQASGTWDKPKPCCAMPCPPHVLFDTIAIAHAQTNETFDKIAEVGRLGLRNTVVSPTNGTMYAKVDFSAVVHETGRISFMDTLEQTWGPPPPYINTADGLVNIGHALKWTAENMMGAENGERPRVRDVVLLGTDSESDDDVTEGVKIWMDRGALIYVLVFPNENGDFPRYEKMLEIAQDPAHVVFYDGDSVEAAEKIFNEVFEHMCDNICDHVLHDHE